jgi:hypothetical protein
LEKAAEAIGVDFASWLGLEVVAALEDAEVLAADVVAGLLELPQPAIAAPATVNTKAITPLCEVLISLLSGLAGVRTANRCLAFSLIHGGSVWARSATCILRGCRSGALTATQRSTDLEPSHKAEFRVSA